MLASFFFSLATTFGAATAVPTVGPTFAPGDEIHDQIDAASTDVAALLALADQWQAAGDEAAAVQAWERVLQLDKDHELAHKGLRHHRYAGQWYTTYAALAKAKRVEDKVRLEKDGVVRFAGGWVPAADLPFHRMGWELLEDGSWAPAGTKARLALEAEHVAAGWQQQHSTWVKPEEFDAWRQGLWKVGDEWLATDAANAAHSKVGAWWEIPGDHFVALTTLPEDQGRWIHWWADQVHVDLERIFGIAPKSKPEVVVVNSIAQYNDFAAGNAAEQRPAADVGGYSSLHYAFFTDGWTEQAPNGPRFRGTGAAYYDLQDANLKPYGQHAIRHAAALAWLESVDPSWTTVSEMLTSPVGTFPDLQFWGEKRIPRWLRYGAAAYCERFFVDGTVGDGGDPLWARKWGLSNLKEGGALEPTESLFDLDLNTSEPAASLRRIHQAGLVVHYILDGKNKKVDKAWTSYRKALVEGGDVAPALKALEAALAKADGKIAKLAGV